MAFHGALVACKALLAAEGVFRTGKAVDLFIAVNCDEVIGYGLEGLPVVHGSRLEALVIVVIQEHNRLFRALAKIIYVTAYIFILESVPVVDDTVYTVREYEVKDGLFGVLVDGVQREVMERRNDGDIAVAFEGLSYCFFSMDTGLPVNDN